MYVYATESGVRQFRGAPLHFTKGEAWHAGDAFVRANPGLFADQPPTVRGTAPTPAESAPVERATRRPGERRG